MKKLLTIIGVVSILASCSDDLEQYNVDPKNPESVDPAFLFSYGQYNLARQVGDYDYNNNVAIFWANYATQTTYIQESSYDAANRDIGGSIWDNIYTESLAEFKKAKEDLRATEVGEAERAAQNNKLAQIKIMEVYAYQYLVDNFGNVPFTEALDINNVTPAYDDAEFIYRAIGDSLSDAISKITVGEPAFDEADLIYGGDLSKWKKFAHSIQLNMGIRVSESNPDLASQWVNAAVAGGVFESNADNADFNYTGTQPYVNPVYDYFVVDSRNTDFVATENFLSLLEGMNDPRVDVYYDDNIEGGMIGGEYGAAGNAYSELTHLNPAFTENPTQPTVLLMYSTILFDKAEAVERGFISGDAAEYYRMAIRANFEFLGLSDAQANSYIAAHPYNASDWETSIGIQKYISLFFNPHEAWTEARRLGIPQLATAASNNKANPKRMIYPVEEVLINTASYEEAASAMGGDTTDSPIFWDVD